MGIVRLVVAIVVSWSMSIPAAGPADRLQQAAGGDAARRVDDYLTRLVPYGFSGAVLIAQDGQIVLRKGYGFANRATQQAYTPELVSCIGSVTKQFTGAAIVKLEMQGKLKTSDRISQYLPGVPPDKSEITIHHLLTHTAGFLGDPGGSDEEAIARDALVARVLAAPLASKPGERFEYSNEGYSLAGAIIERVSGQGYEAYLRDHLFQPAGMRETGYQLPAWPLERLPAGYQQDGREWGRVYKREWLPDGPGWYLRANGGIHASLDDLYRWHVALQSHSVLSREAATKYQTGYASALGGSERYAYGWGVRQTRRGTTVIAHNGGNGVFFTDFRRYVDDNVVIIVMSNQGVIPATELAPRQIDALVFNDAPVIMPPVGVTVPAAQREALAGAYALSAGGTVTVRATDAALEIEASDSTLFAPNALSPPGGRFSDLETRTLSILSAAATGNFRPLFEAFDEDRPFEVVQGNQRKFWAAWRASYGEFVKAEVLGTSNDQGDTAVIVRLQFARGGPVLQMLWGPRRLAGWRTMADAGAAALIAESPRRWVFYRYRLPHLVTVTFSGDRSLTITRGDATIEAKRQ
jgi:CubicO group peptidase (beta-lactamase class C family)